MDTGSLRFGSVCSGIEAASVAWRPLGWRAAWLAEIEPFPAAVLAHHYPDVPNLGDMTTIARRVLTGEVEAPDVLTGGTPCQAFSVAGLRESLADARGNLTLKFVELADAIDHVRGRAGRPPAVIVWENVPGVLSTKDNAYGCFLAGLAGEDDALQPPGGKWSDAGCVYGPRRAVAWRTLDAQHFALAQRRRRVFVVASARNDFDPATVLFEWQGVRRDTPPLREAGQEAAAGTLRSTDGGSDLDHARAGHLLAYGGGKHCSLTDTATAVTAHPGGRYDLDTETFALQAWGGNNTSGSIDVATALNACASASGRMDFESETFVTQPLPFDTTQITSATNRCKPQHGDPCHPLVAGGHAPAIAFHPTQDPISGAELCHSLGANANANANATAAVAVTGDIAHALNTANNGKGCSEDGTGRGVPTIAQAMQVRRLMPEECEALQGFPRVTKTVRIVACSPDQQNSHAPAALQCPKSQSSASPADGGASPSIARSAAQASSAHQEHSSAPVLAHVRIDLDRQVLQLRSQGKLLLSVSTAENQSWCRLPMPSDAFARATAETLTRLVRGIHAGGAASLPSTICSTPRPNGSACVSLSGPEIEGLAGDAELFTSVASRCMKSITSEAGQSSPICEQTLRTWLSCVAAAISSCIPGQTSSASSYAFDVELSQGYTRIAWRGKPASECPDGPRYKAIGNSWATHVARWIGWRIADALAAAGRRAA